MGIHFDGARFFVASQGFGGADLFAGRLGALQASRLDVAILPDWVNVDATESQLGSVDVNQGTGQFASAATDTIVWLEDQPTLLGHAGCRLTR